MGEYLAGTIVGKCPWVFYFRSSHLAVAEDIIMYVPSSSVWKLE